MASPKYRDYFVTVFPNAICYDDVLNIILDMNYMIYALIVHDKDYELKEIDGVVQQKLKSVHKHFVLELKNPISFRSMQNKFPGAHIDVIKYKKASYQYLIHNSPNSKEKYHYEYSELITNNFESVKLSIELEDGLRLFKESEFLRYIAEGINSKYKFVKAFGLNVYKQYWSVYSDMLKLSTNDTDMIYDLEKVKEQLDNELPF